MLCTKFESARGGISCSKLCPVPTTRWPRVVACLFESHRALCSPWHALHALHWPIDTQTYSMRACKHSMSSRTHAFHFSLKASDHLVCFSRTAPLVAQHNTPCTPLFNQISGGQATVVQQGVGRGRGAAARRSRRRSCISLHLGRATPYSPRYRVPKPSAYTVSSSLSLSHGSTGLVASRFRGTCHMSHVTCHMSLPFL
jgi:hypothetical protein